MQPRWDTEEQVREAKETSAELRIHSTEPTGSKFPPSSALNNASCHSPYWRSRIIGLEIRRWLVLRSNNKNTNLCARKHRRPRMHTTLKQGGIGVKWNSKVSTKRIVKANSRMPVLVMSGQVPTIHTKCNHNCSSWTSYEKTWQDSAIYRHVGDPLACTERTHKAYTKHATGSRRLAQECWKRQEKWKSW